MAYDLVVGASPLVKDASIFVSSIEFSSYPALCSLHKRNSGTFFTKLMDQFSDATFNLAELSAAQNSLFELMLQDINAKELAIVYQLISAVSYALHVQQPMHGVAD